MSTQACCKLRHASGGIVPAMIGGPWGWERWVPSTPWAVPPAWAVVVSWLVIAAVAAYSIRTRRRVWPVCLAVVVYVLAAQLPVALIRGGPNTTDELTQSLRYLADLTVPLTAAGALLLRAGPRRDQRRGVRPPIVVALVHRPSTLLWAEYGDLVRSDGLSVVRSVALLFALGRASLLTAFLAAFGRAIAEVGAIIIVGGNIRGFTRTMTTAIALETSKGDLPLALGLGLILLALSVTVSTVAFLLLGRVGEK